MHNFFPILFIISICIRSISMSARLNEKYLITAHSILHRKIIDFHKLKNLEESFSLKTSSTETDDINSESSLVPSVAKTETLFGHKSNLISNSSDKKSFFNKLEDDAIIKIFEYIDYLEEKTFSSICLISKAFLGLAERFFAYNLNNFNPIFTFNERWMNRIVLKFLNSYFDKLKSELCCDSLECANGKFSLELKNLRLTINYLILAFVNEIYYSTDKVPLTEFSTWKYSIFKKLMENDMPKCLKLYLECILVPGTNLLKPKLNDLFNFLKTKPDYSSLLNYYEDRIVPNSFELSFYTPEIDVVFRSILHKDLVLDYDFDFLNGLCWNSIHSEYVIDRFNPAQMSEEIKLKFLNNTKKRNTNIETIRAIYSVIDHDHDDYLHYIWTRNASNLFELDKFLTFKNVNIRKTIKDLARMNNLSLVQIEIFKQLIRYINISADVKDNFKVICHLNENSLTSLINTCSTLLSAIFFKEVSFPFNMFQFCFINHTSRIDWISFDYNLQLRRDGSRCQNKLEMFIIKLRQSTKVPLPLFFLKFESLMNPNVRHLLSDHFDLDQKYIFDASFSNVIFEGISENNLVQLKGKCLNFRELIELFENLNATQKKDIISSLSVASNNNDKFSKSGRPISIFKFIFYGIFEEVDENISELEIQSNNNAINALIFKQFHL